MAKGPLIFSVFSQQGEADLQYLRALIAALHERQVRVAVYEAVELRRSTAPKAAELDYCQNGAVAEGVLGADSLMSLSPLDRAEIAESLASKIPCVDLVLLKGFAQPTVPAIELIGEAQLLPRAPQDQLQAVVGPRLPPSEAFQELQVFPWQDVSLMAEWLCSQLKAQDERRPGLEALTHFDPEGRARMVDVSGKKVTQRVALARGELRLKPSTLELVKGGRLKKGDVLAVAQVGAIMAVKRTADLVPMAHPLNISAVDVEFAFDDQPAKIIIEVRVTALDRTGVEMEALTGVSAAALTIYDMCKSVDREMEICGIMLLEKSGGRSGVYRRGDSSPGDGES